MENLTQTVASINDAVNSVVWGVPALVLLIGTGILMTVLTRFFQFRRFGHMWKKTIGGLFSNKNIRKSHETHSISQFQALCTALSATIGTGNIAGVAYGSSKTLPDNAFKKTGAVFQGWSRNPEAATAEFKNKASVKNLTAENGASVTLYAVWK